MTASFVFVHYSLCVRKHSTEFLENRMDAMGFAPVATHTGGRFTLWNQNRTLFMTSFNEVGFSGIRGLGFSMSVDDIKNSNINWTFVSDLDCYQAADPNYNVITVLPDELRLGEYSFRKVSTMENLAGSGIQDIRGIVYNTNVATIRDFYQELDFDVSKLTTAGLLDNNRRLEIRTMAPYTKTMRAVVCDTMDVFHTTSYLAARGVKFQPFQLGSEVDQYPNARKIRAYNCLPAGKINAHSVENFAPEVLPGMDLIIRSRHQQININEQTLKVFYGKE